MGGAAMRRREFLATASLSVIALTSCATAPTAGLDDAATRGTLVRMARRLYPHDAIADDVYAEVVDGVLAASDEATRLQLVDGAAELRATPPWIRGGESGEIAALEGLQGEPFFAAMQAGVRTGLYEHPAVWAHLGYPGPALPFGGYVDKGFDDIDWLPAESA